MYTEVHTEDVAISLFIKRLSDEDAGQYKCSAVYAGNMDIQASVSVSIFRKYFYFQNCKIFLVFISKYILIHF